MIIEKFEPKTGGQKYVIAIDFSTGYFLYNTILKETAILTSMSDLSLNWNHIISLGTFINSL